jgi:twinkle protein
MKNFHDYGIEIPHNASGEIYTTCPQCSNDRKKKHSKCLGVNVDSGVWVCHHCSWTGGLNDKPKYLPTHWQKPEYRKPKEKPLTDLPEKVVTWFRSRGITERVLARNKIGYGSVYMPQVEDHVSAIAFPYFRGEEHVNTKWRDGQKNFRMEAGAELCLYGLNDIDRTKPLVWVEGEIDKLSVEVAGCENCVSVPNGAPPAGAKNYSSKFDWLDLESLQDMEHILFFDMDEPGRKLEEEISRRLGKANCKRIILPNGCKDANEALVKYQEYGLAAILDNAQDFPVEGVRTAHELSDNVLHLHEHGRAKGVSTGWIDVDALYTVRPGEMTVVTGIPNSGKSNWLDSLIINIAKAHGWRFGIFSPENQPLEEHAASLAEKYSGLPFDTGPKERISRDDLKLSLQWLDQNIFWVLPGDDESWALESILEKAFYLVRKHGINGFILDPWNEIEHKRPQGASETEYISECLGKIRRFARSHNIHFWIVAHPTKLRKQDTGAYEVPTPYDISGSANWRNKADNCVTVYRHMQSREEAIAAPKPVEIHVQKIRFKQVGHIGKAELEYDRITSNYKTVQKRYYG